MENQAITCIVENGNIYKVEYGNKTILGVTAEAYNSLKELSEKAVSRNEELAKEKDKYYNMLIEAGIIKKPKTTEELIAETQGQQLKIMETLGSLTSALEKLNERMGVVENGITKPISNGSKNGDRARQNTASSTNI